MRRRLLVLATIGLGVLLAPSARAQQQITGAGSTFVYPVLSKWAAAYAKLKGVQVNYQSIGSGGGIAQIKAGTVDFGASDAPLSSAALKEAGLAQFPVIVGGIVPVVNLAGVKAGDIKLTGAVLADIYLGKIKKWNDPGSPSSTPASSFPMPTSMSSTAPTAPAPRTISWTSSPRSAPTGNRRSASAPPSPGRPAWAAKATKASPPMYSGSRAPSATSSTLTSCRTR